jgi:hypothetical protein
MRPGYASATDTDDGAASIFMACSNPHRMSHAPDAPAYSPTHTDEEDADASGTDGEKSDASGPAHHRAEPGVSSPPPKPVSDEEDENGRRSRASTDDASDVSRQERIPTVQDCASVVAPDTSRSAVRSRFDSMVRDEKRRSSSDRYEGTGALHSALDAEDVYTKQSLLRDLDRLKRQPGVQLTKEWTMADEIDDMEFELKRVTLHMDESNNVGACARAS